MRLEVVVIVVMIVLFMVQLSLLPQQERVQSAISAHPRLLLLAHLFNRSALIAVAVLVVDSCRPLHVPRCCLIDLDWHKQLRKPQPTIGLVMTMSVPTAVTEGAELIRLPIPSSIMAWHHLPIAITNL